MKRLQLEVVCCWTT